MPSAAKFVSLPDRGVISVSGPDARAWLDNLVTNDLDTLDRQDAVFAGLLTPQGKILFEFFVVRSGEGLLLETQADQALALVKRLAIYKLRAKVEIAHLADMKVWSIPPRQPEVPIGDQHALYADPRDPEMGRRCLGNVAFAADAPPQPVADYAARRVALGIAEAPHDYALGDTFPHEANWDRYAVSFTKGCYVGQEVVSRMQNKAVVRKRVVKVAAQSPLTTGADITVGDAAIGRIGTTSGDGALAMLRLDRAAEAEDKGLSLAASGITIAVDPEALAAYRASVKNKPVIDL